MFFEESNSSKLSNMIVEDLLESDIKPAKISPVNPLKTSPSFGNRLPTRITLNHDNADWKIKLEVEKQVLRQKEEIQKRFFEERDYINSKLKGLTRMMWLLFNTIAEEGIGRNLKSKGMPELINRDEGSQIEYLADGLKRVFKIIFDSKLKKRISSVNSNKRVFKKLHNSLENLPETKTRKFSSEMRESAPDCLHTLTKELVFKKTVLKEKHLKSIVGEKKPKSKKRKRRVKSGQQSLYISNSKKRFKKSAKTAHLLKNKSCNKTKLTLNDHDFSYVSNGVDIWGLTRRNKMIELGSKLNGFESGTLDKGIIFSRPFPVKNPSKRNKSKAHFSLRKIGEAPSKLEWFQQVKDTAGNQAGTETKSFVTGFQSNFIKLSGLRNRSINSGMMSKRSKIKKGSLNQIKEKLKLTAESGSQTNKPRRLNPKLDRKILTCFQKSPKLKNKKVSEFIINSPQSMNSMTILSQKIANTSEMKTWVSKLGDKKVFGSKKNKSKKNSKKIKRVKGEMKSELTQFSPGKMQIKTDIKIEKPLKKGLKFKNLWNEKPASKNLILKVANTTKGGQQNTISFLKIFSTKNGNEVNFDKKTTKLWELFKKQKDKQKDKQKKKGKTNLSSKSKKIEKPEKEEGNKFYYDDSNFNSFIKKDDKKMKKKTSKKKKSSKKSELLLKNFLLSEDFCNQILGNTPVYNVNKPFSKRLNRSKFISSRIHAIPQENVNPNIVESKGKNKKTKIKTKC